MIKIEVYEGKIPWVVGIGTILFGILFAVFATLYPDESILLFTYLFIALIIGAGIWLCMDGKNRKLTVEDMALCYTDWRGRKKNFTLDEIGYCKAALEAGNKDYLKLYDLLGKKLCKLEFNMKNCSLFLQYLLDNQVKIECSEKSDIYLKIMIETKTVCPEEIPAVVNDSYDKVKTLIWEWVKMHSNFGAEWKTGIAVYLEEELSDKKQLWEQEGYYGVSCFDKEKMPEGYLIVIEGYLQKDGEFVIDKKNRAVSFSIPVISVLQSLRIGESIKISCFSDIMQEGLSAELAALAHMLPKNRYHTETISLKHELKERL